MKKHLLALLLIPAILFCTAFTLQAQITVVPNPNAPDIFAWSTLSGGVLSGYSGTPVLLNNSLVLEYNPSATSDPASIVQQLAVYNGGNSLTLIPNPDAGQGVYFNSVQIVFNNKLFFIYLDVSHIQRLASFDGTSITLYPNPDASTSGFIGSPRIFNNQLYVAYLNAAGVTQFGLFNGSGITLIANPDNSTIGFFNNYSVVFGGKIVSRYVTAAGPKQLATFDGTSWTILPNPDNSTRGVYPVFPVTYLNKLYFTYYSATNQYQYQVYDGTSTTTLIANPQNSGVNNGGVSGLPIVYNDTLFFQYYNTSNVLQLAKLGGTSISLVPNPDNTIYGYWNTPVIYNNNLYIFYLPANGTHHLAQYQTASNSLKVYANPDGGLGYWDQPIVYSNKLFFQYYNAASTFQLGYFDGDTLQLVANPNGIYNGVPGNNGYKGYPIIWNNLLYLQMGSVPYGDAGNLGYFDASVLPVSLLNFTVKANGNTSMLQWTTANETNNAYFSIEHSKDGIHFQPIGKINGTGTSATKQTYSFTDRVPEKGINFYRLKQVDVDGNYHYSTIETLTFNNITTVFTVLPNPVASRVQVNLSASQQTSLVSVYSSGGSKVLEVRISANLTSQLIDLSALPAGIYQVTLVQKDKQPQTLKVVKE